MAMIRDAEMFACGAHLGQKHGERPYISHPRDVVRILRRIGCEDQEVLAAAYLHDVIEDTPASYQDIKQLFGKRVAEIVWSVTDELGRNRKERKERTWPKIFASKEGTLLKLADLAANVEDAILNGSKLLQMYVKEWSAIYSGYKEGVGRQNLGKAASDLLEQLNERMKEKQNG